MPKATVAPAAPVAVTRENVEAWAAGLKKHDAEQLLPVLDWAERLVTEKESDGALGACLVALAGLVEGHREAPRASALALAAAAREPLRSLEVVNSLFKDRRRRGYVADAAVLDFALQMLQTGVAGGSERGVYQRACRLLHFLAVEQENAAGLRARGVLDIVVRAMEALKEDPGVLLEACGCLRCLAEGDGEVATVVAASLDVARATRAVLLCLMFKENGELQWRALAALHTFPLPPRALHIQVAEAACAAVAQHPKFDAVVEWAARLLHRLASSKDSEVRAWLRAPARAESLKCFRDAPKRGGKSSKEAEQAVAALSRLCGK